MRWVAAIFCTIVSNGTWAQAKPSEAKLDGVFATRSGYVHSYTVRAQPDAPNYFVVTLSDSQNKLQNPQEFSLSRNLLMEDADERGGKLRAIPLATVAAAIIGTIKDAAFAGKRIEISYFRLTAGPGIQVQPPKAPIEQKAQPAPQQPPGAGGVPGQVIVIQKPEPLPITSVTFLR